MWGHSPGGRNDVPDLPLATAATHLLMHDTDRRRLFLAAVVTLIALPAFFLYQRSNATDASTEVEVTATQLADQNVINPQPVSINEEQPVETDVPTSNRSQLPPSEAPDDDPIFMDGPIANAEDTTADVAIAAQPAIAPLRLAATYLSTVPGTRSCLTRGLESGRTVTVVNLDNGRSVTCVTLLAPRTQRDDIVLHTTAFEKLADLTEAPIPVEVQQ